MNQSRIVKEYTEEFEEKLRAALEAAERQSALGVEVEISIRTVDEDRTLSRESRLQYGAPMNGREKPLERLARALDCMEMPEHLRSAEDLSREYTVETEHAGNARERLETALLEYVERIATGETGPDGRQPDLVGAVGLLDKLLLRREARRKE